VRCARPRSASRPNGPPSKTLISDLHWVASCRSEYVRLCASFKSLPRKSPQHGPDRRRARAIGATRALTARIDRSPSSGHQANSAWSVSAVGRRSPSRAGIAVSTPTARAVPTSTASSSHSDGAGNASASPAVFFKTAMPPGMPRAAPARAGSTCAAESPALTWRGVAPRARASAEECADHCQDHPPRPPGSHPQPEQQRDGQARRAGDQPRHASRRASGVGQSMCSLWRASRCSPGSRSWSTDHRVSTVGYTWS